MGADFVAETLVWDEDIKLDWDAGKKIIEKLFKKEDEDIETDSGCPVSKTQALGSLESIKGTIENSYGRESDVFSINNINVLITGGMSWGDSPTELYNDIQFLELPDVNGVTILQAVGFNDIIDYAEIMKKILKKKSLLPLLMGIDKELDKIISKKLK